MNKVFLLLLAIIILLTCVAFLFKVIYFPIDILNLFPLYHTQQSTIPHNTLISDPVFQFEPWRFFIKQQLWKGVFPFWNNLNSSGMPLYANGQSAVLFPLNFIYYLLPASISLNLIPLLKVYLLLFFSYLYIRSLKISKKVSLFGGFCISFAAFPTVWNLWPHTNVYLFLPLFLFLTEKIISNIHNRSKWLSILAVSYFLAVLGGLILLTG